MAENHDTSHIVQSLVANLAIAAGKGVAAAFTGSGALLAETLHSGADCGNQLLLLLGVRSAQKPADDSHPLGYGRSLYFWSFMVALLIFCGGGVFSVYEGWHKMGHPEAVSKPWIGFGILGFSLLLEGWATLGNVRELRRRSGDLSLFRYLRSTKESDLVVVFGENSAAVLGLILAILSLAMVVITGNPWWDGVGSLAIGFVLIAVAIFLAIEVKSLLIGEAADPSIAEAAREEVEVDPDLEALISIVTVQQGPGEVMVAVKVACRADLTAPEVAALIDRFEARLRARRPEAKWVFVEPGLHSTG